MKGLERIGELYISKSGRGINGKIDSDPRTVFTWYFTMPKEAVRELLDDKRATVPIMLVKAKYETPQSAASNPDL